MHAAATVEDGLNENIVKIPAGIFTIFSFARFARRTAPSKEPKPELAFPLSMWKGGQGDRSLKIA